MHINVDDVFDYLFRGHTHLNKCVKLIWAPWKANDFTGKSYKSELRRLIENYFTSGTSLSHAADTSCLICP